MGEYKNILAIVKEIEEMNNCKCYLLGRGVRNLLRRKGININDFVLVVDTLNFVELENKYPFKKIVFTSIDKYIDEKKEFFEKIYINSSGNIFTKGKGLLSLRTNYLTFDWQKTIDDDVLFSDFLDLLEEGFFLPSNKMFYLVNSDKLNNKTISKILDRLIDTKSKNLYSFFSSLNGLSMITGIYCIERYLCDWRVFDACSRLKEVVAEGFDARESVAHIFALGLYDGITRYYCKNGISGNVGNIIKKIYRFILKDYDDSKIENMCTDVIHFARLQPMNIFECEKSLNEYNCSVNINLECAIRFYNATYYYF